jgi:putative copper export protein
VSPASTHALYVASVTIHVLAAALWVGGMGFFALVVVPVARRSMDPDRASAVLREAGLRFNKVAWICLVVLVATGVTNLYCRGLLSALLTAELWSTPFGHTLAAKLGVVTFVIAASAAHAMDARRPAAAASEAAVIARRRTTLLGRSILLFSLAVVALGVFLVRGAPF